VRDDRERLLDILEAGQRTAEIVAGGKSRFDEDDVVQDALIRRIEVIGEAASNVSDELKAAHPNIPWRRASATRNRTAHGYFDLDTGLIWEVADSDVPDLITQVQALLDETS
jgi:uncharacterized protein with HEPN domain